MAGLDRAFIKEVISMAPYRNMSPLLSSRRECRRFRDWCANSAIATRIVATGLYRRCFVGASPTPSEPVFITRPAAEAVTRRLVTAYENRVLRRLLSRSRSRGADAQPH